jgi:hypothetical protein
MAPGAKGGRAGGWEWQQVDWSAEQYPGCKLEREGPTHPYGWWVGRETKGRVFLTTQAHHTQLRGAHFPLACPQHSSDNRRQATLLLYLGPPRVGLPHSLWGTGVQRAILHLTMP